MIACKPTLRRHGWLFFILLFLSCHAGAYTLLDTGIVTVVLPPGWKMRSMGRKDGVIATYYDKTVDKEVTENLVELQLPKDPTKPAAKLVDEMSTRIHDQVLVQHCIPDEVKQLPVPENAYSVWMQQIECKDSKSGIIQLYIDADMKSIYLFTYTLPIYPFTATARSAAVDTLSSSIQVCYKGKPCFSFHNIK